MSKSQRSQNSDVHYLTSSQFASRHGVSDQTARIWARLNLYPPGMVFRTGTWYKFHPNTPLPIKVGGKLRPGVIDLEVEA